MNNIAMLSKDIMERLKKFNDLECVGDGVSSEEEEMFAYIRYAIDSIEKFLETQKMTGRRFEVGKSYYDENYNIMTIEKITPKGVKFKRCYGTYLTAKSYDGDNEYTYGSIKVKA
jgi:hypothetical protein